MAWHGLAWRGVARAKRKGGKIKGKLRRARGVGREARGMKLKIGRGAWGAEGAHMIWGAKRGHGALRGGRGGARCGARKDGAEHWKEARGAGTEADR